MDRMLNRFRGFVDGLTMEECREQLALAYLHMECCMSVLRGEDVEPVEMMDNGESTDLELYYCCKRVSSRLQGSPKFSVGDEVFYIYGDRAQRGKIGLILDNTDGDQAYRTDRDHIVCEVDLFRTEDALLSYIKECLNG